ncbi:MAG TPA: ABC transporter permease [Bryobacteraceae bacterium]|nr:ABC transporter permease [Bryobacteraceae bacterium]
MLRDLQYGVRQLYRKRLFSATVIILLAIGIGANTLVFSLVNELLLKPLPVRDPGNLYLVSRIFAEEPSHPSTFFNFLVFRDAIQKSGTLSAAVAEQEWTDDQVVPMDADGGIRPVMAQVVSPNYFTELGVPAAAGRVLNEADANTTAQVPLILSYQFWQSQFAGSPSVIGRTIRLKGSPFVIVGVLPRQFHSSDIDRAPDIRLPISAAPALWGYRLTQVHDTHINFRILARLAPGVSPAQAGGSLFSPINSADDFIRRTANSLRKNPLTPAQLERAANQDYRIQLDPIGRGMSQLRDQFSQALRLLLGGVGVLLLAVCANVAGLLLARAPQRQREIGIRLSVGASRPQLMRQLLTENLLLAVPGALFGAWLAFAISPFLVGLLPPPRDYAQLRSPQMLAVTPDLRVLLFAVCLTIFCLLAFGMLPAWRATRLSRNSAGIAALRRMGRGPGVVAPLALQVAFSMILLSAAVLMLRTFWNLEHLDTGFDRAHIVEFTVDPMDAGYNKAQSGAFYRDLADRVATLPGVRSVAFASRGLMRGVGFKTLLTVPGHALPESQISYNWNASSNEVSPRYFETMGLGILAGRTLSRSDGGKDVLPAVVNQALADRFFPSENPLGKLLVRGLNPTALPNIEIVGVTANAKYRSMREPDPPTLYTLMDETKGSDRPILMHVRTRGAPADMLAAIRRIIAALDPRVPVVEALTIEQEIQTSLWQEHLVALLSGFFGVVSVLLAGIALFGSLSYSITQNAGAWYSCGGWRTGSAHRADGLPAGGDRGRMRSGGRNLGGVLLARFYPSPSLRRRAARFTFARGLNSSITTVRHVLRSGACVACVAHRACVRTAWRPVKNSHSAPSRLVD